MKIYHFDFKTREYLYDGEAVLSPLEENVFLIPACATDIEPPAFSQGQAALFGDGEWEVVPDLRGECYYLDSGEKITIENLNEIKPSNALSEPPETPPSTEELRHQAMMTGVEFEGVMCSAFKQDQWGLSSIKEFVVAGNDIVFQFENDNTLTLTSSNIAAFEAVWIPFRQSCLKVNFTG